MWPLPPCQALAYGFNSQHWARLKLRAGTQSWGLLWEAGTQLLSQHRSLPGSALAAGWSRGWSLIVKVDLLGGAAATVPIVTSLLGITTLCGSESLLCAAWLASNCPIRVAALSLAFLGSAEVFHLEVATLPGVPGFCRGDTDLD